MHLLVRYYVDYSFIYLLWSRFGLRSTYNEPLNYKLITNNIQKISFDDLFQVNNCF